jgi:hypothetical protein
LSGEGGGIIRQSLTNEELRRNHRPPTKVDQFKRLPSINMPSPVATAAASNPNPGQKEKGPASFAEAGPSIQFKGGCCKLQ